MCWGGGTWMHGWSGGWLVSAVMLTLFFAVLITGIVVAVRYLRPEGSAARPTSAAAEDVLAHRFARGEIDETEFRQRITALREHR